LTARERQVCEPLRDGRPQREIAERLVVQRTTVYWHTAELRGKLGVGSTYELLKVLMEDECQQR
jgi:DNA-binding NarL/FixJ family response regulator